MEKPNHFARAADIWDVLCDRAAQKETITYGELGERVGVHPRALRFALDPVQAYCLDEGLPPLTILARDINGQLGGGFIAWDPARRDEGAAQVFAYPWAQLENPLAVWRSGATMDDLVDEIVSAPERAEEVFARIRVRGPQQDVFRASLIRIYDGACAISGSSISEGLEASHIVGWAEATTTEAFSLQNGILMQAWYHRLFDARLFDIDDDYYVRVPEQLLSSAAPADRAALRLVADRRISLPTRPKFWPSIELLRRRRAP
ncbi:MAG: HNH endonuclease [Dehalococcoidia bacterium]